MKRLPLLLCLLVATSAQSHEVSFILQNSTMTDAGQGTQGTLRASYEPMRAWTATGQADWIDRFGRAESRLGASLVRRWSPGDGPQSAAVASIAGAPGATILPRFTAGGDYYRDFGVPSVLFGGASASFYSESLSVETHLGFEHYWKIPWSLIGRVGVARDSYSLASEAAFHPSAQLKLTHFFTDDDRAWISHARGSEGFGVGGLRGPESIATWSLAVGGRKAFSAGSDTWAVEAGFEYQSREGSIPRILSLTTALSRRW